MSTSLNLPHCGHFQMWHQQARFLPRRAIWIPRNRTSDLVIIARNATTDSSTVEHLNSKNGLLVSNGPTRYGLPHTVLRSTMTVFSGILQPEARESRTRIGSATGCTVHLALVLLIPCLSPPARTAHRTPSHANADFHLRGVPALAAAPGERGSDWEPLSLLRFVRLWFHLLELDRPTDS